MIPQTIVDYGHLDFKFWRDHQELAYHRSKSFYIIEGKERATEAAFFIIHTCSPMFINLKHLFFRLRSQSWLLLRIYDPTNRAIWSL